LIQSCPGVYEPEDDSYMLVDALLSMDLKGKRVLDMGTGTGIIAIAAAQAGADVTAVDVNPLAVRCCEENARRNGVRVRTILSNLFERVDGIYDVITFNPPYLPGTKDDPDYDLAWSGGENGRAVVDRFLVQFPPHLAESGVLLLVQSSLNDPDRTKQVLENLGFCVRIVRQKGYFYEKLYVLEASRCP